MRTRDSLETETRVVDAPDAPPEAVESPQAQVLDDPQKRREASADSQQQADGNWKPQKFEVDREELGRFDLKRAGLPDMSIESAAKYIDEHRATRPWLAMADRACPEARRIIAALDAAGGHAHIRHEGWVTEDANRSRVAYREDPAQLDPENRSLGIDGLRQNGDRHRSGDMATRIDDPDAFVTALARSVQHPKVREALEKAINSGKRPSEVAIPIKDLLGPDGYRNCTGWQLEPVDGSIHKALEDRADWVKKRNEGRKQTVPEPRVVPVPTFEGGEIVFAFARNEIENRYEVVTMFPRPTQKQLSDTPLPAQLKEQ
jgi:hypothetical protein